MTIATAISRAALRVTGDRLGSVYSNNAQIAVELADLANEVAQDIADSHQWQALTSIAQLTGDGTLTAFALPSDYSRMLIGGGIQKQGSWLWSYRHVPSVEEWLHMRNGGFVGYRNTWILLGGQLQFNPAPSGVSMFPYIRNTIVQAENGSLKREFDRDDDEFVLDERLITLALIWRWREQKGLEYAEDMATYEKALSQQQTRDAGPSVITRRSSAVRSWNTVPEMVIAGDGAGGTGADTDYVAIYEGNQ